MKYSNSGQFNLKSVNKAKALQKSIFGKRRLTDDSKKIIRKAREEREKQL